MIDCHLHLLPGLDDGPSDLGESLALARALVEDGVETAICTPHVAHPLFEVDPAAIGPGVERLREALAEEAIPLEIHAGAEIHVGPDTPDPLLRGDLPCLGEGDHYLLELPGSGIPAFFGSFLDRLLDAGFGAVIAHPERLRDARRDPALLRDLRNRGALLQVTAEAVLDEGRGGSAALAGHLLAEGLVDILASDTHGTRLRPPCLTEAEEAAARVAGPDAARAMVRDTPARVCGLDA